MIKLKREELGDEKTKKQKTRESDEVAGGSF